MAHTPHTYSTGDTITAALLNQAEQDLAAAQTAADVAAAVTAASTNDRARANHTGTQAASTITGLATVATSGAYTDLSAKPTIPTVGAAGAGAAVALSSTDTSVTNARTPTAHTHPVADLTATGTRDATTFLRGDNTWATPAGGGSGGSGVGVNASDVGYDLILALGQSNMSGSGGAAYDATRFDPPGASRIWQYAASGSQANTVSVAAEPLGHPDAATGMGPALVFARWYLGSVPENRRVLVIPAAWGGTAFEGSPARTWKVGRTDVPNLYEAAIAQATRALAQAGSNSRIVCALWLQGESDGDNGTTGPTYQTDLDALITGLRSRLSLPNLPFIIGQMVPEYLSTGTRAAINTVQQATPSRQTKTAFCLGPTNMNQGDGNHYTAAGQRSMGRLMFDGYLRILTGTADPSTAPTALPTAPALAVAAGDTQVTLSITGGSGVTSYALYRGSTPTGIPVATSLPYTDTGLTNGTAYTYVLLASNAAGSVTSNTVSATPAAGGGNTAPGQVTGLTAGTPASTSVPLSWTAPASNGGAAITDYVVQYRTTAGPGAWTTFADGTSTTTSATVTGLTASTSYDFQVAAVNSVGTGTYSAATTASTAAAAGGGSTGPALTTVRGTPTYSAGKIGNALSGGVLGTTAGLSATVGTVECWAKATAGGVDPSVAVGSNGTSWFLGTQGGFAAFRFPAGNTTLTSTVAIPKDGTWHHFAGVVDGAHATLFVDGVQAGQAVNTGTLNLAGAGQTFGIGGWGSDASYDWTGQVDEVRVSNSVRYTGTFTPATTAFTTDANTIALYHLDA